MVKIMMIHDLNAKDIRHELRLYTERGETIGYATEIIRTKGDEQDLFTPQSFNSYIVEIINEKVLLQSIKRSRDAE